ncbi:gluconate kinase [Niabella ginsenosidivorans]|uniref:Gluconokinase n=2 Tax=Niabella ginsenosidivorans TaxID=1176587 RepID=A0A1A9IAF7_9BACT|nr:gluconate kinase [Niabella ginsenosidivorans]
MGVSGSGKTTIGQLIAREKGYVFIDGDELHPPENIAKMQAAIPLTDEDRWAWLKRINANAMALNEKGVTVVVACSALKKVYRDLLRNGIQKILFICVKGSFDRIHQLIGSRNGHFMPVDLLKSQFETLEVPDANETDCVIVAITSLPQEMQEINEQLQVRDL